MKTKFKKGDIVKMIHKHDDVDEGNTGTVLENHVYPLIKWNNKSIYHPELHPTLEGYLSLVSSRRWVITKKILMIIPYLFLYIIYLNITWEQRIWYQKGLSVGVHVYGTYSTGVYKYKYGKKPERLYLTWKEYWISKGYGKVETL